jgi:hypothetical protein
MDTTDEIKNKFRALVAAKGFTVTSASTKAQMDGRAINNKLMRGSLRVTEYIQILEGIGYEIKYENKLPD